MACRHYSRSCILHVWMCKYVNHSHIFISLDLSDFHCMWHHIHVHVCQLHMHTDFTALLNFFFIFFTIKTPVLNHWLTEWRPRASIPEYVQKCTSCNKFFILFHVTVDLIHWTVMWQKMVGSVSFHSFWQTCRTKETTNHYFLGISVFHKLGINTQFYEYNKKWYEL